MLLFLFFFLNLISIFFLIFLIDFDRFEGKERLMGGVVGRGWWLAPAFWSSLLRLLLLFIYLFLPLRALTVNSFQFCLFINAIQSPSAWTLFYFNPASERCDANGMNELKKKKKKMEKFLCQLLFFFRPPDGNANGMSEFLRKRSNY